MRTSGMDLKRCQYINEMAAYIVVDRDGSEMSNGRIISDVMGLKVKYVVLIGDPLAQDIYILCKDLQHNGYRVILEVGASKDININYFTRLFAVVTHSAAPDFADLDPSYLNVIHISSKADLKAAAKAIKAANLGPQNVILMADVWPEHEIDLRRYEYKWKVQQ